MYVRSVLAEIKNLKCKLNTFDASLSSFERFAFKISIYVKKTLLWLGLLLRKDIELQFGIFLTFGAVAKYKYIQQELCYDKQTLKARARCQAKDVAESMLSKWLEFSSRYGGYCKLYFYSWCDISRSLPA